MPFLPALLDFTKSRLLIQEQPGCVNCLAKKEVVIVCKLLWELRLHQSTKGWFEEEATLGERALMAWLETATCFLGWELLPSERVYFHSNPVPICSLVKSPRRRFRA